jgi:hypothetical protein
VTHDPISSGKCACVFVCVCCVPVCEDDRGSRCVCVSHDPISCGKCVFVCLCVCFVRVRRGRGSSCGCVSHDIW